MSHPRHSNPGKQTQNPLTEIWVDPMAVMNGCGKSRHPPGFKLRTAQPVSEWVKTTGKYRFTLYINIFSLKMEFIVSLCMFSFTAISAQH
jgi:hypothetical protein